MKNRHGSRMVALVALVMALTVSGVAVAGVDDVTWAYVQITPAVEQAFAEYGIGIETLLKASNELTGSEKMALSAVFGDDDVRPWINGLVNAEMWEYVVDNTTVAQMRVGGRVYRIGTPDAFDALYD